MALKKAPAPDVDCLTPDEQISYLFHQHALFADWRLLVDERLQQGEEATRQLNGKVESVERKVDGLAHKVDNRFNEVLLVQQQILLVVQGQRVPGLETPGMAERVLLIEVQHASRENRLQALEEFRFRVLLIITGITGLLGLCAWRVAPYLTQILAIVK